MASDWNLRKFFRPVFMMIPAAMFVFAIGGCRSAEWHRTKADKNAQKWITRLERSVPGRESSYILTPAADELRNRLLISQNLPTKEKLPDATELSAEPQLMIIGVEDALRIGAAYSSEYQSKKESVFRAALNLDVESEEFRTSWAGALKGEYRDDRSSDENRRDVAGSFEPKISRLFATGASVMTHLAFDLTRLLTLDKDTAYGLMLDASVTLPLLQGAGRSIVLEPLTQAERSVIYALYDFERYKRAFAVRVASEYLGVLEKAQQIANAEDNYKRLDLSTARAERMAESGRMPATQVDQTRQDLLRARERLIAARQNYQGAFDNFKLLLGLPVDAELQLDPRELQRLSDEMEAVKSEMEKSDSGLPSQLELTWQGKNSQEVIDISLSNRLDLFRAEGKVEDAHRAVKVAKDALRGSVTVEAGASYGERRGIGSAEKDDVRIEPSKGRYRAILQWDPPWRRVRERNRYREALLDLERAQRDLRDMEDQIKQQVRAQLRGLYEANQSRFTQARAVQIAERRAASTELFMQAGRSETRDMLEAQEALVSARNSLLSALVRYRTTEWSLQRDLDVLKITDEGLWYGYNKEE